MNAVDPKNYVESEVIEDSEDMDNVEMKYKAVVVLNTTQSQNTNVNKMVAIANYSNLPATFTAQAMVSLSDLQAEVGEYGAVVAAIEGVNKDNFLMTSASYADAAGQVNAADVKAENLCNTKSEAEAHPVEIFIERVVAKADLKLATGAGEYFATGTSVTLNGVDCMAYPLKDKAEEQIEYMGTPLYVVFTGWNITGTTDKSYLFKHVNNTTAWAAMNSWKWNNAAFNRCYWAANPAGVTLNYSTYSTISKKIAADVVYFQENAADDFAAGTKSTYDPATQTTNRTQAIVAATLVTISGGVATPVTVAKWGGANYEVENLKTVMVSTLEGKKLYEKEGGNFVSVKPEHLTFVPAEAVDKAVTTKETAEDAQRYMSYLQIANTTEAQAITYYTEPNDAAACTDINAANSHLKEIPGARIWKDGKTYYYSDLKHLGTGETEGLYGVVRNHIYRVNITKVLGLGTPVNVPGTDPTDPDYPIIPQKPEDNETYVAAQINVLSWRIVKNDTSFEW